MSGTSARSLAGVRRRYVRRTAAVRPRPAPLLERLWTKQNAIYGLLVLNIIVNIIWVWQGQLRLNDLGSFLHSGVAHREGLNPYGYYFWLDPLPISREALNLNPPISVYFFDALTYLDPALVRTLFLGVSVLMYAVAVWLLMREYPQKRNLTVVLTVLALTGLWHMVYYLQIYAPLLLAVVGAWLLLRREKFLLAGVLIGLVIAIKPNYALVPLMLLAAGYVRIAVPAVVVAAGISALPLLFDGPLIYKQWLDLTVGFDGLGWTSNAALMAVGEHLGAPMIGRTLAVAVTLTILWAQKRYRPAPQEALTLALIAVVLFGPVSWAGYTLFLLPFLFSREWDRLTVASIAGLTVPFCVMRAIGLGNDWLNTLLAPLYAWAVVLLLVRLLREYVEIEPRTVPRPLFRRPEREGYARVLVEGD